MVSVSEKITKIDDIITKNEIVQFFLSYTGIASFYGIFLFLYELQFCREILPVVHPILIGWAMLVLAYHIMVKKEFSLLKNRVPILFFCVSVFITAIINFEVGIIGNIKAAVLVIMPLFLFYSVCLSQPKENRKTVLVKILLGASFVVFVASVIALWMYALRFREQIIFMGIEKEIGLRLYDPRYEDSGLLLYGIYVDTNHAAIYAIIFALYGVLLYGECKRGLFKDKWKNILGRVYAIVNIIVQVCYFPLANSRGAWLCLVVAAFLVIVFWSYNKLLVKSLVQRFLLSSLISFSCVLICMGGLLMVRTVESECSLVIKKIRTEMQEETIPETGLEKVETQEGIIQETGLEKAETQEEIIPETGLEKVETQEDMVEKDNFTKKSDWFGGGRIEVWKEVPELLIKFPVFGTGAGNNQYYAIKYNVAQEKIAEGKALHNSYLDLLLSYGFCGFITLLSFFLLCSKDVLERLCDVKKKKDNFFYISVFIVLVIVGQALLLSNIFINTTAMYYIMLSIVGYLMGEENEKCLEK